MCLAKSWHKWQRSRRFKGGETNQLRRFSPRKIVKYSKQKRPQMYSGDCDAAILDEAAAAVLVDRARVGRLVLGMEGWACLVLICHQQKRTFDVWRTSSRKTSTLIFVFRMTSSSYVHRGSGHARVFIMYPRRWLSLSSRAKAFTLRGRHRRFVADSAFHTSFRGALLLVGDTA